MQKVVLIPGDGIGPEVADAVIQIFQAARAPIEWERHFAGVNAMTEVGELLPDATLDALRTHGVGLKGPCTTPVGKGFTSVNVQMRKGLKLYGAARPVKNIPGIETRFSGVDIVVLRENSEGLYSGLENEVCEGVVTTLKVTTEAASRRMAKWSFDYAKKHGRKKVTVMHKANIMKKGDGMFLRIAQEEHANGNYEGIELDSLIIDAGCMRLVQDPTRFDVLLLQNFYGDMISDLCAAFVGGLGVVPGANFGDGCALFEAVHGSAPDIAGQGVANPLALLNSAIMMLDHLDSTRSDSECKEAADRIRTACSDAIVKGETTKDLGGSLNTQGFVDAIKRRLS